MDKSQQEMLQKTLKIILKNTKNKKKHSSKYVKIFLILQILNEKIVVGILKH